MTRPTRPFARTLTTLSAMLLACAASSAQAIGFSSPSGNIRCYIDLYTGQAVDDAPLICAVFEADWPLDHNPNYPECDLDSTRQVILPRSGPARGQMICHGDVFWPAPLGKISYGSQWSLMGYTCFMETDGVRCDNGAGASIAINRARLTLN